MTKRKRLPWVKLWDDWYTSPSHLGLSPLALHVGPRLLCLASASPVRGELRGPTGVPLTLTQLALACRLPVPKVRGILDELAACGTVETTPDGAARFPGFEVYQETPDAKRKRKQRGRGQSRDSHADSHGQSHTDVPTEERGERREVRSSSSSSPRAPDPLVDLPDATATVRLTLDTWEAAGLRIATDYVDPVRATTFHRALLRVASRHRSDLGALLRRVVDACAASSWVRGETPGQTGPVDAGWLLTPRKKTALGPKPLTEDELVERLEQILAGYYGERSEASPTPTKPKHPVIVARDMALEAAARAQAPMWPDDDPDGPEAGALRVVGDERERRARWVRGGEA